MLPLFVPTAKLDKNTIRFTTITILLKCVNHVREHIACCAVLTLHQVNEAARQTAAHGPIKILAYREGVQYLYAESVIETEMADGGMTGAQSVEGDEKGGREEKREYFIRAVLDTMYQR